jgi:flagellar assembly protein FliH
MMAHEPVKFTFDTSFETPSSRRKQQAPPEPTFSAAELDAARQEAFAQGEAAGRAEQALANTAALAQASTALAQEIDTITQSLARQQAALAADAATLGHTVARRLCETLTAALPLAEVTAMVTACIQDLKDEPRIVVYANPDLLDEARPLFEAIAAAQAFPGRLIVLADQALAHGDVRVEWAHGGILRDMGALMRTVDATVSRYVAARRT